MSIAYLNIVHKNPHLLARAIRVLSVEGSAFFVHVDKKARLEDFSVASGKNVFFSEERIPVYWGEFSNVDAIIKLMIEALDSPAHYEYLVHMQGADYPLRSGRYIQNFLNQNRGHEFISMVRIPAPGYPISKIGTLRLPSDKPIGRFIVRALGKAGLASRDYRKHLGPLEPYAGDACWALSREACQYILEFANQNPRILSYFRNTFAPEESLFHTILGNSIFRDRTRRSLLYRYWPLPGPHPMTLTDEHVEFFERQGKVLMEDQFGAGEVLFARKFSDETLTLVDRLDTMIDRKDQVLGRDPSV